MAIFFLTKLCVCIFVCVKDSYIPKFLELVQGVALAHSLNTHAIAWRSEVLSTRQVERLGYPVFHMSI